MVFEDDSTSGSGDFLGSSSVHEVPTFSDLQIGDFSRDIDSWSRQTTGFTCAIVSQKMILEQFDIVVSEAQLVYEATSGGFLSSAGTSPDDVGRLLEHYGVTTHKSFGLEDMVRDLSQGHKVIVAVDSGELSGHDGFLEDMFIGQRADHALVVNGLDLSDPNNPQAVLNDPGRPDGAGLRVPLSKFLDAWNDSGQFYVATDEAPPDLVSDPSIGTGFDPNAGLYMDQAYWERFLELLEALVTHVASSFEASQQFTHYGMISDPAVAAVIQSITGSVADLTSDQRNEILREI
ncbi:MAG TPA: hypothetical protein DDZ51_29425 [Planctomycetaceae bacterium]|nr:hypothetical protein [Planctomycetaceae bacterium]